MKVPSVEQAQQYLATARARQAEFLLSSAVDARDYAKAVKQVRKMGLDPARIRHRCSR